MHHAVSSRSARTAPFVGLVAVALVLMGCSSTNTSSTTGADGTSTPPGSTAGGTPAGSTPGSTTGTGLAASGVKHVFIINLENESYDATFGASSKAVYLNKTLLPQGKLLTQYYGIGHASLDNYLAQISGQAPNPNTQGDCVKYVDFEMTGTAAPDQAVGKGCVYPASVKTIADQLQAKGLTWKGYMEDMANDPAAPKTCRHPEIGQADATMFARAGDQYATRHNPFVYFHSIIDSPSCQTNVVALDALSADLASAAATPNYAYITPTLCHDGHDEPCVDGQPGGLTSADAFLAEWVPKITDSPAFKDGGMLIVTFDEAELIGAGADSTSCCGELPGPNTDKPGISGPGGGRVGAVVVSPFVKPGTTSDTPYNHYALLCSTEKIFGLDLLGMAGQPGLACFGPDVFDQQT